MSKVVAVILFAVPSCWAQIPTVANATSAPIPGSGHDYLHMLSETVNPANGSLSMRINVPLPQGRGLTVPFSMGYDSDLDAFLGNNGWTGAQLNVNGWSQGFAQLWYNYHMAFEMPDPSTGIQPECDFTTDYVVELPDGEHANLPISIAWTAVAPKFPPNDNVCADLGIANGPLTAQVGSLSISATVGGPGASIVVTTGDGTQYQFAQNLFQVGSNAAQFSLPIIVDRNGNIINTTGNNPASSQVSYTDTLGRTSVKSSGFGSGTSTLTVSGLGGPYTLVWSSITSTGVSAPLQLESYSGFTTAQGCWSSAPNTTFATNGQVLSSITLPNGQKYSFHYDPAYGMVNQITYPDGASVSYTWGVNQYSDTSVIATQAGTDPNQAWSCMWRYSTPVVTERKLYDGSTELQDQKFSYAATTFPDSTHDWSSKQTTATDTDMVTNQSRQTVYTYKPAVGGPYRAPNDNNYGSAIPVESQISYRTGTGTVLRTVTETWLSELAHSSRQTTLENGQSSLTVWCYNNNLQVIEEDEYDFGTSSPSPAPCATVSGATSGPELRKTVTSYATFGTTHIVDRPSSAQVYNGSGSLAAEADYVYDQTAVAGVSPAPTQHNETNYGPSSTIPRGNVTTVTRNCIGCTNAITTYTYDETGQALTMKDPDGQTSGAITQYSYADSFDITPPGNTNAYLTKITLPQTNGVNHIESFKYAYADGQLISSVDQNSQTTNYLYNDSLRRLTETDLPDGGKTTISYKDTLPSPSVTTSTLITSAQSLTKVAVMDGLGRVVQTQVTSDPEGTTSTVVAYDGMGRPYEAYNPTRCATPTTNCGEATWGFTTSSYDALGRITSVTKQDGSVASTSYSGNCTTATDEAGKTRKSCSDGLGRLTGVWEDPGSSPHLNYETDYSYDPLGNLLSVVQNGSRQRNFNYNSLSQLLSATNPESGTISYTYDASGNVLTKTAPGPNQTGTATVTTTYSWDSLHRLTGKTYSDGTIPVSFSYDVAPSWMNNLKNVVGRLVEAKNANAGISNSTASSVVNNYDVMGRVVNQWLQTPSVAPGGYFTSFTYDLSGNSTSTTDAAGTKISYSYDSAARVSGLTSSWVDAQHPATLWTADATQGYYAPGLLRKAALGNGLTETAAYNSRLQPCRYNLNSSSSVLGTCTDALPSGTVQDYNYGFGIGAADNGNVATMVGSGNQVFNRAYGYDALNRLQSMSDSASGQACKGLSWGYDAWGNRTAQTATSGSCFQQPVTTFSAKNQLPAPYQYDAAGNMTNDGVHSYTYDAESRLTQVDSGSTASYVYDASGRRIRKNSGGSWNEYFYDVSGNVVAEKNASSWPVEYAYRNGSLVAQYRDGTTYFVLKDHLGSTRLLTGVNQSIVQNLDYLPFGEINSSNSAITSHDFTSKERDAESGLDYFGARYLSSTMGRFLSPDEPLLDQHASDPQSWNLYSYVRNNPLSNTDPDGQVCYRDKDGNLHGDCSSPGDEKVTQADKPQTVKVNAGGGSSATSFLLNFLLALSNAANDFFRPLTNAMGVQPSYMQNIPTGSGGAATAGAGAATAATFFIGPEADGINITAEGLEHVATGHTVGGALATVGKKSVFNAGEDVKGLIKAAEGTAPVRQATGNFERVVDAGRTIGVDRTTGAPTSTYTVITKPNGNLVTAFPGKP